VPNKTKIVSVYFPQLLSSVQKTAPLYFCTPPSVLKRTKVGKRTIYGKTGFLGKIRFLQRTDSKEDPQCSMSDAEIITAAVCAMMFSAEILRNPVQCSVLRNIYLT